MSRPASSFNLDLLINGTPTALGVIASGTGATKNNSDTAAPFTIPSGAVLRLVSDLACVVNVGATADNVVTSAVYGWPLVAGVPKVIVMPNSSSAILLSVKAAAAVNVNVATMS